MFVAGTMLPFQILLLPVFRLSNSLGIYNTHWSLIIIHTAFQMAFCTFVLRNFMRPVPTDILDAARVDGCSEFRIYWQIMLPISLPSLAALATLEFTWIFNDYLWAIIDAARPVHDQLAGDYRRLADRDRADSYRLCLPAALLHSGADARLWQVAASRTPT